MAWRDTIKPVEVATPDETSTSSWRDTISVDETLPKEEQEKSRIRQFADYLLSTEGALQDAGETIADTSGAAVRSASFGLADELAGITGAIGDTALQALGVYGERSTAEEQMSPRERLLASYRAHRDASRQQEKEARERSPIASVAGDFGGALMVPAASGARYIAQGATAGARALRAAEAGMLAGSAYGAGTSEADLTKGEVGEFAKDVATGGTVGGATGGVLTGAGQGIRQVLTKGTELPMAQVAKDAAERASKGELVHGVRAFEKLEDHIKKSTNRIVNRLSKAIKDIANEQDAILSQSTAVVDMSPTARGLAQASRQLKRGEGRAGVALTNELRDAKELEAVASRFTNKKEVQESIKQLRALKKSAEKIEKSIKKLDDAQTIDNRNSLLQYKKLNDRMINIQEKITEAEKALSEATNPSTIEGIQQTLDRLRRSLNLTEESQEVLRLNHRQRMINNNAEKQLAQRSLQSSNEDIMNAQAAVRKTLETYRAAQQRLKEVPLREAWEQQRLLRDMEGLSKMGESAPLRTRQGAGKVGELRREASEGIYQVSQELRDVNEKLTTFNRVLEASGLEKISAEDLTDINAPKFEKIFRDMIGSIDKKNMTGFQKRDQLNTLADGLSELMPEMREEFVPILRDLAKRYELIGPTTQADSIGGFGGTARQLSAIAGAMFGSAQRYGREFVSESPWLQRAAQAAARGVSGASRLHRILENASTEGASPEAVKYMIMQNPAYREILGLNKDDLRGE